LSGALREAGRGENILSGPLSEAGRGDMNSIKNLLAITLRLRG
jgi:hypothetical protein